MRTPRPWFGLTLMVNHACNLRCSYCYTGAKFHAPLPAELGARAIDRALGSLAPAGHLDLALFGGEPLLESARILDWMAHARQQARAAGKELRFNLTTNGTISHRQAWQVMLAEDLDLAVSFDGHPQMHDRHRRDVQGHGTAERVIVTLRQLLEAGKPFRVVVVVRPDTLEEVPAGLEYLHELGVREIDLSLDLWATWTGSDGRRLQTLVERAADLWREWLPDFSLNWFEAKIGELTGLPVSQETTRCGFGSGEIAVAPSGRLYPCERLIGEDRPDHPLTLAGHAAEGRDFLDYTATPFEPCGPCSQCFLSPACDTVCRCSNFVRTGDVNRPDGLLCLLNKAAARAAAAAMKKAVLSRRHLHANLQHRENCYVR